MPLLGGQMLDQVYPFTPEFNDATVATATNKVGKEQEEDARNLYKRKDLRLAHPPSALPYMIDKLYQMSLSEAYDNIQGTIADALAQS
jgi:hypothetical protein